MAPVTFVCISICWEYVMYVDLCQSNFSLIAVGVSC